ncbi:MAG TPA: type II CAAX endopeptidase family protein [Anaerolineales bacterium]|nr:type II CAAX endopeptidase family protein [Anaerolineales bacterium]
MFNRISRWIHHYPLIAYFGLVFGVEWLLVISISSWVSPLLALLIGSWLPNLIGLLVTGVAGGSSGLGNLFSKVIHWRIGFKWYAAALFFPIVIALLSIILYFFYNHKFLGFAPMNQLLTILIGAIFTGALGEELGWRGTALPRLQARWNPLISSLILGVLWGLYHLPSFLLSGLPLNNAPILQFMLCSLAITCLVTWIFNHTNGSLIPVFIIHASFNFISSIILVFSNPALAWIVVILLAVGSSAVILLDWKHFSQQPEPLNDEKHIARGKAPILSIRP